MAIKRLLAATLACMIWMTAPAEDGQAGKAILDFSKPPNQLYSARLVQLDGKNMNAPVTRTSFWVEPGVHEIVVAAAIDDPMQVGLSPRRRAGEDPGKTTIEVVAGKRYKIAAMVTDEKGNWEPVIWKEEDL